MTSTYGWLITHDSLAAVWTLGPSNSNAKGMIGPRDIGVDLEAQLTSVATNGYSNYRGYRVRKFKIYDDDGELYYTGLYVGPDGADLGEDAFGPLDDFGTPNAGATEIRYYNRTSGEYEAL
jgi:hypothetical protein